MVGNLSQRRASPKEKCSFSEITGVESDVFVLLFSLKKKIDSQNDKIEQLNRHIEGLKQKNESIVNYANDKLR